MHPNHTDIEWMRVSMAETPRIVHAAGTPDFSTNARNSSSASTQNHTLPPNDNGVFSLALINLAACTKSDSQLLEELAL